MWRTARRLSASDRSHDVVWASGLIHATDLAPLGRLVTGGMLAGSWQV
jgi:hypothetical protein